MHSVETMDPKKKKEENSKVLIQDVHESVREKKKNSLDSFPDTFMNRVSWTVPGLKKI